MQTNLLDLHRRGATVYAVKPKFFKISLFSVAVLVKIVYLQRLCSREEWLTGCLSLPSKRNGALAHLVERLVRNQKVVGSSPICSTYIG